MRVTHRITLVALLICCCASTLPAQTTDPPIDDQRLTVHTLIREDIFSGWRTNNAKRLERGEANIEILLEKRPDARADLLAWKGGIAMYRAAVANEEGDEVEYAKKLKQARAWFAEAQQINPRSGGVYSLIGGSNAMFGDRIAKADRAAAWEQSYQAYSALWRFQGSQIDRMPLHLGGELLGGLAMSAQRTGRTEELNTYLDKIIEIYGESRYAKEARAWKADPAAAAKGNITCKSCHAPGRLKAVVARLDAK